LIYDGVARERTFDDRKYRGRPALFVEASGADPRRYWRSLLRFPVREDDRDYYLDTAGPRSGVFTAAHSQRAGGSHRRLQGPAPGVRTRPGTDLRRALYGGARVRSDHHQVQSWRTHRCARGSVHWESRLRGPGVGQGALCGRHSPGSQPRRPDNNTREVGIRCYRLSSGAEYG